MDQTTNLSHGSNKQETVAAERSHTFAFVDFYLNFGTDEHLTPINTCSVAAVTHVAMCSKALNPVTLSLQN